ncbi:MAG: thiol peroxidase [Tenericutes bacterium HGW-Tenericutes-8]|nr:MAG: thiol peroxidase [Tenericutes bacterium HGW-Tenericutes-8]
MKTFKQKPITVLGKTLAVGDQAPDFFAINRGLETKHLKDFDQKYVILNVVPSLDTSVCSLQTRTINERLAAFSNALVLTISNDLPFAQARYCGAEGLDNIITLSDHRDLDFAMKYGVLIQELRLLARSVFVLDENRKVIYVDYLDEMTLHPNYDQLFAFLDSTIQ